MAAEEQPAKNVEPEQAAAGDTRGEPIDTEKINAQLAAGEGGALDADRDPTAQPAQNVIGPEQVPRDTLGQPIDLKELEPRPETDEEPEAGIKRPSIHRGPSGEAAERDKSDGSGSDGVETDSGTLYVRDADSRDENSRNRRNDPGFGFFDRYGQPKKTDYEIDYGNRLLNELTGTKWGRTLLIAAAGAGAYHLSGTRDDADRRASTTPTIMDHLKDAAYGLFQNYLGAYNFNAPARESQVALKASSTISKVHRTRSDYSKGAQTGFPIKRWHTDVELKNGETVRIIHRKRHLDSKVIEATLDSRQKAQILLEKAQSQFDMMLGKPITGNAQSIGKLVAESPRLSEDVKSLLKNMKIAEEDSWEKTVTAYREAIRSAKEMSTSGQTTIKIVDGVLDGRRGYRTGKLRRASSRAGTGNLLTKQYGRKGPELVESYADLKDTRPAGAIRTKLTMDALRRDNPNKLEGPDREHGQKAGEAIAVSYAALSNLGQPYRKVRKLSGLGR